jgi:hypothetical protein
MPKGSCKKINKIFSKSENVKVIKKIELKEKKKEKNKY